MMKVYPPLLCVSFLFFMGCPSPDNKGAASIKKGEGHQAMAPAVPDWESAFRYDVVRKPELLEFQIRIAPGFHAYAQGEETGRPLKVAFDEQSASGVARVQYPPGVQKGARDRWICDS